MKKYLLLFLLTAFILSVSTTSQTQPQTQQEPTITLKLSVTEVNYILEANENLPAKIANPLSLKIRQQATAQLQVKADSTKKKP